MESMSSDDLIIIRRKGGFPFCRNTNFTNFHGFSFHLWHLFFHQNGCRLGVNDPSLASFQMHSTLWFGSSLAPPISPQSSPNFFLHHFSFSECISPQVDETSNLSEEISVNTWPHLPQNTIWAKVLNNTFCSSPPPKNHYFQIFSIFFPTKTKPPCFHLNNPNTTSAVLKQQIQGAQQEPHTTFRAIPFGRTGQI